VRLLPRRRPTTDKLKQAGDVEGLRAMLEHRDYHADVNGVVWDLGAPTRAEATRALATFEGPVAEDGLTFALGDPHPTVRQAALDAIADLPRPTAVERLLQGLVTWPYPTDYAALEQAITILVDWAPEGLAEDFARRIVDPAAPELDERHEDTLTALLSADPRGLAASEKVADQLVAELEQPASAVRAARAEEVLTWLGERGTDRMLRALEAGNASAAVVRAAAGLRDARAVEPLVALLGSSDTDVRAAAATALGRLNDTRAVQALLSATQDPQQSVRDAASEALNGMGMAAVMVVVASVMRDAVREQLAAAGDAGGDVKQVASGVVDNTLPAPEAASGPTTPPPAGHPPTWAQEVLGRLLRRAGGQQ
jgi:HEAT repeat protein